MSVSLRTALRLIEAGDNVCVLDNLYCGHRWAVFDKAGFYKGSIHARQFLRDVLGGHETDSVVHFAGYGVVPESVSDLAKYCLTTMNYWSYKVRVGKRYVQQ